MRRVSFFLSSADRERTERRLLLLPSAFLSASGPSHKEERRERERGFPFLCSAFLPPSRSPPRGAKAEEEKKNYNVWFFGGGWDEEKSEKR